MSGFESWKHGGVRYPLTDSTSNSLLEDADPAVFYALTLFESVLDTYVKPRLLAQAALEGLNFPSAVEKTLHIEPTPFLLSDQMVFPIFCLWRSEETWAERNISNNVDASVWEWSYVLPPLTPRQIEQLHPIFRSVAVVVSTFAMQSFDPAFEEGTPIRDLSGIQKMQAGRVRYGTFEQADGDVSRWWKAVHGQLLVHERSGLDDAAMQTFTGVNNDIDLTEPDGTKIEAFVEVDSHEAPTVASIAPASGTKAGGTLVTITGSGFNPTMQAPLVLIGGAYASGVVVTHPTTLVCATPEHTAFPTFAADVQVIDRDGQESNVLEAAFTFLTP